MTVVHGLLLIILGAAVIIGTVVGGVCLLAKAIADANRHDINTCECPDCKHRRISRYIKNYIGDDEEDLEKQPKYRKKNDPRNQKSGLTATVDLRQAKTREAEVTELILGQEDHMPCPYTFCSAIVTTRVTMRYLGSPPEKMIVAHEIENEYLSGPCYAGLMWWPLGKYEVTLIRERERVDYHRILELSLAAELHGLAKPPAATPPAESRTLRGPQRMGREPATEGEESDAWQMGGRQDPDVQQPTMRPKVPEGVTGYEPGRHMATISEIESALAAAATQGTEAYGALNEAWQAYLESATEKLDQAMNTIANVNDSQNSDLLAQAYAQYKDTWSTLLKISALITRAQENILTGNDRLAEFAATLRK
jgi:hypothetical protein